MKGYMKKTKFLIIRISQNELDTLKKASQLKDMSVAEFIRICYRKEITGGK